MRVTLSRAWSVVPLPSAKSAVDDATALYSSATLSLCTNVQATCAEVWRRVFTVVVVTALAWTASRSIYQVLLLRSVSSCPSGGATATM